MLSPLAMERVAGALHRRVWSINRGPALSERVLLLLDDGAGEAEWDEEERPVAGPCVVWIGTPLPAVIRLEAGSSGWLVRFDGAMLGEIVGNRAESAALGGIVGRSFALALDMARQGELRRCLEALQHEIEQPLGASQMVVLSYLRIVFVAMLRLASQERILQPVAHGEAALVLQRFRQLVELHFREHWEVRRYAAALGISADRLHAICVRELGKPPKKLVAERLLREAATQLARSMLTIKQISFALGFRDPAHFGNFFKLRSGRTPSEMRASLDASRRQEIDGASMLGFADWP